MTFFGVSPRQCLNWRSGLAVVTGLAFTLALLAVVLLWKQNALRQSYELETASRQVILASRIQQANTAIAALATLFNSAQSVDADQFRLLAGETLQRWPFLRAAFYAPRIHPAHRDSFEAAVAEAGLLGFHIQNTAPVEFYYPVRYFEPFTPLTRRWLGLDLSAVPYLVAAIQQAEAGNATRIASGVGPFSEEREYWLLHPLYSQRGHPAQAQRNQYGNGVVGFALAPTALSADLLVPGEWLRISLRQGETAEALFERGEKPAGGWFHLVQHAEFPLGEARLIAEFGRNVPAREWLGTASAAALVLGGVITLLFLALTAHAMARHAAEIRYRTVADNTYDWETWVAPEGHWIYCSPACQRLTGYSPEAFLADPKLILHITHPEDQAHFRAHWEGVAVCNDAHVTGNVTFRIRHLNGATLWIEHVCVQVFDQRGRYLGRRSTNRDVSERMLNEVRMETLLRISQEGMRMSERELLQMGLEQAERLTGSEIGYLHFLDEDQQTLQLNLWSHNTLDHCQSTELTHYPVAQAGVWADTVRLKRPVMHNDYPSLEGRRGYPESHTPVLRHLATPIMEEGQVRMILGVGNKPVFYTDTDLRGLQLIGEALWKSISLQRAMTRLETARAAAEAASRAKSTFLANMSHELRTPMNGILGMTSLALRHASDPKLRDQLGKIEKASQHLLAVINDILDLSKIEAARLNLERVSFKLGAVLENLISIVGHKAINQGLQLRLDLAPEVRHLALIGDPLRLGQVLLNLTGNALKFTEQGVITVRVSLVETSATDALLRFEVQDTGIGISAEDQRRLFTAFEQADGSMTRKYGGTGLGLAISKRLVQLMGGDISVASAPGQGSTFWFTARMEKSDDSANASDAAPPAPDSAEAQIKARFAGVRLLLAEDEPVNQEVSRDLLEDVGLRVDLAEDGAAAVTMARQTRYALILMDMQMPNLNGVDATRAIRADSLNRNTPILAMTANAFQEDRQVCIDAGMNDHIGKPVDPDRLFETLLQWLDAPTPQEATP